MDHAAETKRATLPWSSFDLLAACRMTMLENQIIQLSDETREEGIATKIHTSNARLHSEPGNKKLKDQIAFLQREKIGLNDRRPKLEEKLMPEGMPCKG